MKKINWNNVEEATSGGFEKLPPNGYQCLITKVEDFPDKEYLRFEYEIGAGEYKGFFKKQYDADTRAPKKWSGFFTKMYRSDDNKKFFKAMVTAFANSNPNWKWDEIDEQYFKNKKIGLIMREEEYLSNKGELRTRVTVDMPHSIDKIKSGDFKIREIKKLDPSKTTANSYSTPAKAMTAEEVNLDDLFGDDD